MVAVAGLRPSWRLEAERLARYYSANWNRIRLVLKRPTMGLADFKVLAGQAWRDKEARVRMVRALGFDCEVRFVEHHTAHAFGAYMTSGWDDCLVVTMDGEGDNVTQTVWAAEKGAIRRVADSKTPHSAGLFYKHVTRALGFKPSRHAGKITGLAAYGKPSLIETVGPLLRCDGLSLRTHPRLLDYEMEFFLEHRAPAYIRSAPREDVAATFQQVLERTALDLVRNAVRQTGLRKVVLSGGVAANVKMNQHIRELPEVENVYVFPPMGDDGIPLGAALWAWREMQSDGGSARPREIEHVYLGPGYTNEEIVRAVESFGHKYEEIEDIESFTGDTVADGGIVGRFHGRMEYGPRALGNRSILALPTDPTINDWLNDRLRRSEFMPFAPSGLIEHAPEVYVGYRPDHFTARFMTVTYGVTEFGRERGQGCTHVDGTARPQLVTRQWAPEYHSVLQRFHKRTGIPFFINTSFNMHEEPIVCSPQDALRAFDEGAVDLLCLQNIVVRREKG
jgi:carbamoyltransferase